ncbi:MAG: glycosyltransferase [Ruminobacter sp.]|nr:glycosyltransferase [Ruminobacter sp.]
MNTQSHSNPLLSIIVPIYNSSKFLSRCCDSLIKQDPNNICEFIMVNDGSKDNSIDILNEYAAKDSRFKIFSQENQGAGIARNFGIKQANGEYVGFLDNDDELSEDYSNVVSEIIKNHQAEAIICSRQTISVSGKKSIAKFSDHIKKISTEYDNGNWVYISKLNPSKSFPIMNISTSIILQRKLINERKIHFAESRIAEDVTFTAIFHLTFEKIYISDAPIYIQHQRLGSLENTQITDLNILFTQLNSLDNVRDRFKLEGAMLNNYYDMLSTLCFRFLSKLSSSKKLRKEFLEKIEVYFSNERYKEFRNYVKRKQMLNITNFINSKNERVKTLIIFGFYIPLWKKRKHNSNKS